MLFEIDAEELCCGKSSDARDNRPCL